LADQIGAFIVDPVYAKPVDFSSVELVVATWAYALQIYLDFSAYSDIAIGLGRVFGLKLPVNFRKPYSAANPREHWQGWHITLSTWLRDYLYISLGGKRGSTLFRLRNVMITMLLGGLWHGAVGTYVIWGGLHGVYVCIQQLWEKKPPFKLGLPRPVRIFLFFQLICLTFVFFRSPTVGHAWHILGRIVSFDPGLSHITSVWLILLAGAVFMHTVADPALEKAVDLAGRAPALVYATAFMGLFMIFYVLSENNLTHRAFIYFQF
ncbi:MAG: MBOAT family protein, partial [Deltaproteobacteria bacterium]|nr:MBOAT family protein [Deltaproteobacteria bacterium]